MKKIRSFFFFAVCFPLFTCFSMEEASSKKVVAHTQVVVVPVAHDGEEWQVLLQYDNDQWSSIKGVFSGVKVSNQQASGVAANILGAVVNENFTVSEKLLCSSYHVLTKTLIKLFPVEIPHDTVP